MHIYCPKCHTGYNVDEALIPEEGRRLRCSSCKEVFRFDRTGMSESVPPADWEKGDEEVVAGAAGEGEEEGGIGGDLSAAAQVVENAAPEIDMKEIFERLSEQSEKLFQAEQKLPWQQRLLLQLKTMLGLNRKFNLKFWGMAAAVVLLLGMYSYRYEIVRTLPFMNWFYRAAGIRAKIPGEGLEFQNINWNYIDSNGSRVLEVKGFINNPTTREIEIPIVHVELLDKNTILLQSINQKPSIKLLKPDSRVAIGIVIKTPSPTAKYVYLTFIDVD